MQLADGKSATDAIAFAESLLLQAANHRQKIKDKSTLLVMTDRDNLLQP